MRVAYSIATWSGARYVETVHSLPEGARLLTINTKILCWPLAKAWNYATRHLIEQEGYDVVIHLNDDVVLLPESGDKLAHALVEGQFSDHSLDGQPEILMATFYNARDRGAATPAAMREGHWVPEGDRWQVGGPDFAGFAIGRRFLEVIGDIYEGFVPAYFEDNDTHRRIQLAGYEAASYTPFFHYGSTTLKTDAERQREVSGAGGRFDANRRHYIERWGGPPGAEVFQQPFVNPFRG